MVKRIAGFLGVCAVAGAIAAAVLHYKAGDARELPLPIPAVVPRASDFDITEYQPLSALAQTDRIPAIVYHDIVNGAPQNLTNCSVRVFKQQIAWLAAQGAHPISLETLQRHLVHGDTVPSGAIVLTFDCCSKSFHDLAYPILKKNQFPFALFVPTNNVGDSADTPNMDWKDLSALEAEGLATIGSHGQSLPSSTLPDADERQRDMAASRQTLEAHLAHPVPYLVYNGGTAGTSDRQTARQVGYTLAFSDLAGYAEESPDTLDIGRFTHGTLKRAWLDAQTRKQMAPAAVVQLPLNAAPVRLEIADYAEVKLGLVHGGKPVTFHSKSRQSVGEFVQEAGGVAGINGTFFANARLNGTDAALIGPSQSGADGTYEPDFAPDRLPRLVNRPLVIWGPTHIAIVPFQPASMNASDPIKVLMPDFTDVFMGGAWIVHNGKARSEDEMAYCAPEDFNDPRKRAFFGFTKDGEILFGATIDVVTTTKMAEAAAAAGVQEAVLLDSGFSTSVIYDNKIIVTGHTDPDKPSRPIPHAIVLQGTLAPITDPEVTTFLETAPSALGISRADLLVADGGGPPRPRHRKRKRRSRLRRHHPGAVPTTTPSGTAPPDTPPADTAPTPDPTPTPPASPN